MKCLIMLQEVEVVELEAPNLPRAIQVALLGGRLAIHKDGTVVRSRKRGHRTLVKAEQLQIEESLLSQLGAHCVESVEDGPVFRPDFDRRVTTSVPPVSISTARPDSVSGSCCRSDSSKSDTDNPRR